MHRRHAALASSLAVCTAAILIIPPAMASPPTSSIRDGAGVAVTSDLVVSPKRYNPGRSLAVSITGPLTITAQRDVVCHSLTLSAMRGAAVVLARYASTDATPQFAGDVHSQQIAAALELDALDVPRNGTLVITIDLQCSPMDADGQWTVAGAASTRIATARIRPAAGTVSVVPTWHFPDDEIRPVRPVTVTGTAAGTPVTIVVTRGSTAVWQTTVTKATYRVTIPLTRTQRAGTYRVVVSAGAERTESTFRVSRGWAPLVDSAAGWPRCSTITWRYDGGGAPAGGDTRIVSDLTTVFDRFATLTGLRFVQSSDSRVDIRVNWDKAPYDGPAAAGGAADLGGVLGSGVVTMFRSSNWARTPGFGVRGRGALLYHEIGHVLGLGHVSDSRLLMYPYHTFGESPLTPQAGDIAGLRELYDPDGCR